MKVFKKPVVVHYEVMSSTQVVNTLEGPVTAGEGQILMTGIRGEKYPMPLKHFQDNYTILDAELGSCAKKKIIVDATQIKTPTTVRVSWSNDLLHGKPGDYLVTYNSSDMAIVEKSIFEETYEVVGN